MGERDAWESGIDGRLSALEASMQRMDKELKSIDRILTGNGRPEDGLVHKMGRASDFMKQLRWGIGIILASLAALLASESTDRGGIDRDHLREIIQMLERVERQYEETP